MKKILIICTLGPEFDESCLNKVGVGGSETWVVQLADAFARKGNDVSVLCKCQTHYAQNGVKYISLNDINFYVHFNKFDLCIVSREYGNMIQALDAIQCAENIYIQAHDVQIFGDNFNFIKDLPHFRGISTLSAFQERSIHEKNGVDWKYFVRIGNGIDPTLFEGRDFTPTNKRLLHSSCYYRGGDIMKEHVVPEYVKVMNDAGCDYCTYDALNVVDDKHNKLLGSLSKDALYSQMANRYCWFYPLNVDETFCITMIENIMCENDIIMPFNYGPSSVLEPFVRDITMKHDFLSGEEEFKLATEEAVARIVKSINQYDRGAELRNEMKDYVLQNYTWDRVADKWLKLV